MTVEIVEVAKSPTEEADRASPMDKLAHGILPEVDYGDLEFYECLSTGTYGAVYRSEWKSQQKIVAVKRLLVLEKEAHVLSVLRHKNIIQFYGAVTKAPNFCIITEFADKGSLFSHLANDENADLTFSQIVEWAIHIASGVNYLHNEAPVKIVHRDLKSKNVVISANDVCKLCDFGTSKAIVHSSTTGLMSVVGTVPWMSPEMIQSLPVNERTDTWSFAVVLWELCTREIPFKNLDAFRIAWMVVEEHVRLPVPSSCPAKFADLMSRCFATDPKKRPDFREILKILQGIEADVDFSSQVVAYFNQKAQSKIEIDEQLELLMLKERELSAKERNLSEWENRLRRREQNIEMERTRRSTETSPLSYDVNIWDEEDVVLWLLHLPASCEDYERLNELATLFRQNHITGCRLSMLTDVDLLRMGLEISADRQRLLIEIGRLMIENQNFLDFPSLAFSVATSNRSRSSSCTDRKLELTLLFGVYIRKGPTLGTHKWKLLMDYDDDNGFDDVESLIEEVRYVVSEAPHVYKICRPPFVMREWAIGFTQETTDIQCIVTFSNMVRKPRNAKLNFSFEYDQRGILYEKPVELMVKTTTQDQSALLGGVRTNRTSSFATSINSPMPTIKSPLPNLQGAWLEKAIETSNSFRTQSKSDASDHASSWASVAAGSTATMKNNLLKRLISEEMKRSMATSGDASYFVEGALSFDDEPSFPKNDDKPSPSSRPPYIQEDDGVATYRRRADSGFAEQQQQTLLRRHNTECGGQHRPQRINKDNRFRNSCADFPNLDIRSSTRRTISTELEEITPPTPNKVLDLPTARRNTAGSTSDYHSHSSSLSPKTDCEVLWPKRTSTPTEEGKFLNAATDEFDTDRRFAKRRPRHKSQLDHVFDDPSVDMSEKEEQQQHMIRKVDEERRRTNVDAISQQRPHVAGTFQRNKSITAESPLARSKSEKHEVLVYGGYSKWKWKG